MMSTKKLVKVEGADMLSPLPTLLHPSFSDCVVYLSWFSKVDCSLLSSASDARCSSCP